MRKALELALEAFEWNYNTDLDNIPACEKWAKMLKENITAIKEALAQPEQEPVLVECGNCHEGLADMEHVCKKCLGAGWVNNPQLKEPEQDQDEVDIRSRLYQRIHELETQLAQPEQPKVRTGDCLLVGVCASEGHKIQAKKEQEEYLSKAYRLANELRCHLAIAPAPQRTWVGLTDDDEIPWDGVDAKSFAKVIEAKLKEKNC